MKRQTFFEPPCMFVLVVFVVHCDDEGMWNSSYFVAGS